MWYTDAINEITQYFVDLEYNNTKENKARVKFGTAIDISKMQKETKELLAQAVTMIQNLALQQEKIEKAEQKKKMEATDGKPSDTE